MIDKTNEILLFYSAPVIQFFSRTKEHKQTLCNVIINVEDKLLDILAPARRKRVSFTRCPPQ
jgi:hypothetical protein